MATEPKKQPVQVPELGYGTRASTGHQRLVNPDGSFNVRKKGTRKVHISDVYHALISLGWWKFFGIVFGSFVLLNFIFAGIYYFLGAENLAGVIGKTSSEKFWECFFFSSQTLTTLGYGRISPVGAASSTVAAIESMVGLLSFALSTSLLWGRFSRPTAKVIYSQNALIAPYRGFSALMFRAVNGGRSRLIEIQADVTMARTEKIENLQQRRFYRLKLEISSISVLPTSWTIVHPIDEESPMAGRLQQEINDEDTEVLVMLKAFDETYSQTVYSRTSYKYHQIVHGGKFLPMVEDDPDGVIVLDMDKLDSYQNVTLPPNSN